MKIKHLIYIQVFLILLSSCNLKDSHSTKESLVLIDSFAVDGYEIHMLPVEYKNYRFYLNKERIEVIKQNTNDNYCEVLNFSKNLRNILNLKIFKDSLLIINGIPNLIIYNLKTRASEIIPKPIDMASNIIINDDNILVAGINMAIDTPYFALNTIEISNNLQQTSIVNIEPQFFVDDYLLSGYLLKTTTNITFVFDWLGEYFVIDKYSSQIKKTGILPLKGNYELFVDQINDLPPYYQAYSADTFRDSLIFILREVDFEKVDMDSPNEEIINSTLRKKIHVFNEEMELINSFQLQRKATQIKIINKNLLYTLHHKDNKIYIYEINY